MTKKIVRRRPPRPALPGFARWAELCWTDREGRAVVQCVRGDAERHHATQTLSWPSERAQIEKFIAEHLDCGRIHATPVLRDPDHAKPREEDACLDGIVCWADIDFDLPVDEISRRLGNVPAAIVETGGPGRHHVYVPLDVPYPPQDIKRGNEALRRLLEADAVQSPSHLMSIPGTYNHRYGQEGNHPEVALVSLPDPGDGISVDELVRSIGPSRPVEVVPERAPGRGLADPSTLSDHLWKVINEAAGPKRGSQAYHAVLCMMEEGLGDDEIRAIAPTIPAIAEKYEQRIDVEVDRILDRKRPEHDHAGKTCQQASCPKTPTRMTRGSAPAWPSPLTPAELLDGSCESRWLVEDVLRDPTYGMIAGPAKALKSWLGLELVVAVASGTDFLGRFPVTTPGAVVLYVNEGSKAMLADRLARLARARDLDLRELPIHSRLHIEGCRSPRFFQGLESDLEDAEPALVILDPWYGFHGGQVDATNLMADGEQLARLSQLCLRADASLILAHHFTKNAKLKYMDISAINQSGGAPWCDSWILTHVSSRTGSDVNLRVVMSGRDVGAEHDLSVCARGGMLSGRDAPFAWEVATRSDDIKQAILEVLDSRPEGIGIVELRGVLHGGQPKIQAALDELLEKKSIFRNSQKKYFAASN